MSTSQPIETPVAAHADWARAEIERRRRAAYANPLTGSDLHFAEATRLDAMGDGEAAEAARQRGVARYLEIQAAHPYPEL